MLNRIELKNNKYSFMVIYSLILLALALGELVAFAFVVNIRNGWQMTMQIYSLSCAIVVLIGATTYRIASHRKFKWWEITTVLISIVSWIYCLLQHFLFGLNYAHPKGGGKTLTGFAGIFYRFNWVQYDIYNIDAPPKITTGEIFTFNLLIAIIACILFITLFVKSYRNRQSNTDIVIK